MLSFSRGPELLPHRPKAFPFFSYYRVTLSLVMELTAFVRSLQISSVTSAASCNLHSRGLLKERGGLAFDSKL